jgi:two-component system response regulator
MPVGRSVRPSVPSCPVTSSQSPAAGSESVLLVEDNPNDEALALRALGKVGLGDMLVVVRDGAEALDYLLGSGDPGQRLCPLPRVVLLDLKLPKVDGLEVLRRLRAAERTRTLPVVVFTSSDEDRDQRESYRLLANSYVRKPVQFEEFSEAVQQVGLYWTRRNLPAP